LHQNPAKYTKLKLANVIRISA